METKSNNNNDDINISISDDLADILDDTEINKYKKSRKTKISTLDEIEEASKTLQTMILSKTSDPGTDIEKLVKIIGKLIVEMNCLKERIQSTEKNSGNIGKINDLIQNKASRSELGIIGSKLSEIESKLNIFVSGNSKSEKNFTNYQTSRLTAEEINAMIDEKIQKFYDEKLIAQYRQLDNKITSNNKMICSVKKKSVPR